MPSATRSRAARAGIAFVSNDRKSEGLFLDKSVAWNLVATRLPSAWRAPASCGRDANTAPPGALAERRACPKRRLSDPVVALSGGNQQKASSAGASTATTCSRC